MAPADQSLEAVEAVVESEMIGWYWRKNSERPSAHRNPLVMSSRSSIRDRIDFWNTSTRFFPLSLASYMAESASLSSCSVVFPGSAKATPTLIERPTWFPSKSGASRRTLTMR
jgi:hypothetical protein